MTPAPSGPNIAYIGLGSNVGERADHLRAAVAALAAEADITVTAVSGVLETMPVGGIEQPPFLNAVVEVETTRSPRALLDACQRIERERGRDRRTGGRWGPRTLDLDILLFGSAIVREPGLTIPHPRLPERRFVLGPLTEIAPKAVHPGLGRSVESLFEALGVECGPEEPCS
ncbi:MAG: 2-amino-4-hydroxy-6-hydroxymethyldihydropteridine diphosphokinase [Phycisphaerales bacterium]|nr:2-amino-4-hydroxy-6-hydroxymethyldihydropteridine diphosphokinase [Phycisphaerales bacterium]NNM25120.1 2-amino-4-hydroxy-6-hydroxymethyldihydropteridine diphosphokinase [Phycisphaerales bacterium]